MFIVYAILIFFVLVFIHELGHFISARAVGIGVNEFALGMGPKILKKQGKSTLYSLRAFPVGGFCAMEGEDEDSESPTACNNKGPLKRALVLVSGSAMNILFAVLILSIVIFMNGEPIPKVSELAGESVAAADGLEVGDTLLEVDGQKVKKWADLSEILSKKSAEDTAVTLKIEKENGDIKTIETSLYVDESGALKVGVTPVRAHGLSFAVRSVGYGFEATWGMTKMMVTVLGELFTGKAGLDQLTGPIGIVKTVDDTVKYGFIYVLQLAALISLNLGIVNMLPFPGLDGGRILFLIIRLFTGKRISDSVEGKFHLAGFVLLIGLMIYITVIDIDRFILK
jgi:regulator of sigma E protease